MHLIEPAIIAQLLTKLIINLFASKVDFQAVEFPNCDQNVLLVQQYRNR